MYMLYINNLKNVINPSTILVKVVMDVLAVHLVVLHVLILSVHIYICYYCGLK